MNPFMKLPDGLDSDFFPNEKDRVLCKIPGKRGHADDLVSEESISRSQTSGALE